MAVRPGSQRGGADPNFGAISDPVLFGMAVSGPCAPFPRDYPGRAAWLQAYRAADRQLRQKLPIRHTIRVESGAGKLLICAIDLLDSALQTSPEAGQLMTSLTAYVGSAQFQPTTETTPEALVNLMGTPEK
jgi:hypothetical protein